MFNQNQTIATDCWTFCNSLFGENLFRFGGTPTGVSFCSRSDLQLLAKICYPLKNEKSMLRPSAGCEVSQDSHIFGSTSQHSSIPKIWSPERQLSFENTHGFRSNWIEFIFFAVQERLPHLPPKASHSNQIKKTFCI